MPQWLFPSFLGWKNNTGCPIITMGEINVWFISFIFWIVTWLAGWGWAAKRQCTRRPFSIVIYNSQIESCTQLKSIYTAVKASKLMFWIVGYIFTELDTSSMVVLWVGKVYTNIFNNLSYSAAPVSEETFSVTIENVPGSNLVPS